MATSSPLAALASARLELAMAKLKCSAATLNSLEKTRDDLKKYGETASLAFAARNARRTEATIQENDDLRGQLSQTINNYDSLAKALVSAEARIEEQAKELESTKSELRSTRTSLDMEKKYAESAAQSRKSSIATAKQNQDELKEKLEIALQDLHQSQESINVEINTHKHTKESLTAEINAHNHTKESLTAEINAHNHTKESLTAEINTHNHTKNKLDWAVNGHNNAARDLQNAVAYNHQLHASLNGVCLQLQNTQKEVDDSRIEIAALTDEVDSKISANVHGELQAKLEHTTKDLSTTQEELTKANARIAVYTSAPHLKNKKINTSTDPTDPCAPATLADAKVALACALRDAAALRAQNAELKPTCDKTRTCRSCIYHLRKSLAISRAAEDAANALVDEANIQRAAAWSELNDYKKLEGRYPILTADAFLKEEAVLAAKRRAASESESSDDEAPMSETYRRKLKEAIEAAEAESDRAISERDSVKSSNSPGNGSAMNSKSASENHMAESDGGSFVKETADQAVVLEITKDQSTVSATERGCPDGLASSGTSDTARVSVGADDAIPSTEVDNTTTPVLPGEKDGEKCSTVSFTASVTSNSEPSQSSPGHTTTESTHSSSSATSPQVSADDADISDSGSDSDSDSDEDDDDSIIFILESPLATAHAEMKIKKLPTPEPQDRTIDSTATTQVLVPKSPVDLTFEEQKEEVKEKQEKDTTFEERKEEVKEKQEKDTKDKDGRAGNRYVQQTFKKFFSGLAQTAGGARGGPKRRAPKT